MKNILNQFLNHLEKDLGSRAKAKAALFLYLFALAILLIVLMFRLTGYALDNLNRHLLYQDLEVVQYRINQGNYNNDTLIYRDWLKEEIEKLENK